MIIEYDREFAQVRWSWDNGETWKYVDVDDLILEHEDLVHCKDCKYNYANMIPGGKGCQKNVYIETADNWYCADGERINEVENGV